MGKLASFGPLRRKEEYTHTVHHHDNGGSFMADNPDSKRDPAAHGREAE